MSQDHLTAWLWATPNSNRVSILFEELGLHYEIVGVNIRRREQFAPEILAMNPYGKIPIVAWDEGGSRRVMFESGAILIDFALRHGRFLPSDGAARSRVLSWLMVVLTGLAPLSGQAHHWTELAPEKPTSAVTHIVGAVERIYRVLDRQLAASTFLCDNYSIADIAAFPWITRYSWVTLRLDEFVHLKRWHDLVASRPAVKRGMAIPDGARLEG